MGTETIRPQPLPVRADPFIYADRPVFSRCAFETDRRPPLYEGNSTGNIALVLPSKIVYVRIGWYNDPDWWMDYFGIPKPYPGLVVPPLSLASDRTKYTGEITAAMWVIIRGHWS